MKFQPQDFARCAGASKDECGSCLRNVVNSPVRPDASRQVWIGSWVMTAPCPQRVPQEAHA